MSNLMGDAFQDLLVVEFAQGVAAPYCGLLLSRNGADVIKVEPQGNGDWCRSLGRGCDTNRHCPAVQP